MSSILFLKSSKIVITVPVVLIFCLVRLLSENIPLDTLINLRYILVFSIFILWQALLIKHNAFQQTWNSRSLLTSEENQNESSQYVLPSHYYDRHTKTSSKLAKVTEKIQI